MQTRYAKLCFVIIVLSLMISILACDITKGCAGKLCQNDNSHIHYLDGNYVDDKYTPVQLSDTMTARVPYLENP